MSLFIEQRGFLEKEELLTLGVLMGWIETKHCGTPVSF
jgi:hypothetical protein